MAMSIDDIVDSIEHNIFNPCINTDIMCLKHNDMFGISPQSGFGEFFTKLAECIWTNIKTRRNKAFDIHSCRYGSIK